MKISTISKLCIFVATLCLAAVYTTPLAAEDAATKAKIEAKLTEYKAWGSDAKFIEAFKASLAARPADAATMTQDKWKALTLLDPAVRAFSKNQLGELLKTLKKDAISEIFVSTEDGSKVAFLSKTSSWSHKGKDKHDKPMAGQTWIGAVEMDESSGTQQVQISFPVLDGGKPIGSVVVGLSIDKLTK